MATKTTTGSTNKKTSSSRKTSSSKTTSSSKSTSSSLKLTTTEKKLVELYRAADSDTKKEAMNLLKGETSSGSSEAGKVMEKMLKSAVTQMIKNATK